MSSDHLTKSSSCRISSVEIRQELRSDQILTLMNLFIELAQSLPSIWGHVIYRPKYAYDAFIAIMQDPTKETVASEIKNFCGISLLQFPNAPTDYALYAHLEKSKLSTMLSSAPPGPTSVSAVERRDDRCEPGSPEFARKFATEVRRRLFRLSRRFLESCC